MLISTSTILIKYINWFQRHKRIWNLSTGKPPSVLYPNLLHQGEFVSSCTALSAGWHMNHHPDPNTHPSPLEPLLAGQPLSLSPLMGKGSSIQRNLGLENNKPLPELVWVWTYLPNSGHFTCDTAKLHLKFEAQIRKAATQNFQKTQQTKIQLTQLINLSRDFILTIDK